MIKLVVADASAFGSSGLCHDSGHASGHASRWAERLLKFHCLHDVMSS